MQWATDNTKTGAVCPHCHTETLVPVDGTVWYCSLCGRRFVWVRVWADDDWGYGGYVEVCNIGKGGVGDE